MFVIMILVSDIATEFVGTFFFVATIIATSGQAIAAGVALAAAIFLAGQKNPANFNPAVSLAFMMRGNLSFKRFLVMVGSQIAAAVAAYSFVMWVNIKPTSKPI